MGALEAYWRKRDFAKTPEPRGNVGARKGRARFFCVQKHAASHLHYDFRLELEGVLKSWAVPKGPSLDPTVRRLAMETEDHPLEYGEFEGIIPQGEYGGGTVLLWDRGTWIPLDDDPHQAYRSGKLHFRLRGRKLRGDFALERGFREGERRAWRLRKLDDEEAVAAPPKAGRVSKTAGSITDARPESVSTGRSLEQIAHDADRVWRSNRNGQKGGEEIPESTRRRKREVELPTSRARARARAKKPARMPRKVALQRWTDAKKVPSGARWVHEIAIDGVRLLARIEEGEATLLDGRGRDVSARFPAATRGLRALSADALLDVIVADLRPDGTTAEPAEHDPRAVAFALDLLFLEGEDLRKTPLIERKATLEDLIASARHDPALRYVRHFDDRAEEVFARACELGASAVLARRADAPYRGGESNTWRRVRCHAERPREERGVVITKPKKLLWRDDGITKGELAEYYRAVADHVVPHVRGRPLTLVRANDAVEDGTIFMRHSKVWGPNALRRVNIQEKTKVGEYLIADDLEGVLALVQMSIVEIHTWNTLAPDVELPDRVVFDLDPDEGLPWSRVVSAARLVRARLRALGHESFVKTTGGKGLHVVVPLIATADWQACLAFSRAVSEAIEHDDPKHFTTAMPKERRRGRILIDYLRNNRTNTSIAAFSTRARPGAPVSMPVAWEDLARVDPQSFTLRTVPRILARRRRDPWAGYDEARRALPSSRRTRSAS